MRYPNKQDQEMYNTIRMFMGFGKGEEIFKLLENEFSFDEADTCVYQALVTCEMMRDKAGDVKLFDYYENILKSCEQAIHLNPKHWLAYYLRFLVGILMEREMEKQDESIHYLLPFSRTSKDWENERMTVIKMQREHDSEPFFIIPYLEQALAFLTEWNFDEATEWVKKGLEEVDPGPVIYLASVLQIPFVVLYKELREHDLEIAEDLKERFELIFSASID